jgi:hypothetical protein
MPCWEVGTLAEPPRFTWRNWVGMVGPGMVMAGAAIGGGEWLLGPKVTAQYGGAMLWFATLSILGQVVYNIEISRYTLYCGEPIFSGKFRTLPGPAFWLWVYLLLDFGSVFPYLASNAATPLATLIKGSIPDPAKNAADFWLHKGLSYALFVLFMVPLLFGGKVYNTLRWLMTIKIVVVFGFLLLLALMYSSWATWREICGGFVQFGSVPVLRPDDPHAHGAIDNVLVAWWEGRELPAIDFTMLGLVASLAAIAGQGGLSNTPISNYTRDQGWGMGREVGAIPSLIGGRHIRLSHVGRVFQPNAETLPRWRRWCRHVMRDQLVVWMPACFVGIALPSMLSVEFLPRGVQSDNWTTAVMTAQGVHDRAAEVSGAGVAGLFWFMTIFCGFLVLGPSMSITADGLVRRWVDVFWISSQRLRKLDTHEIRRVYFTVLACYTAFGLVMLSFDPGKLVDYATMIYNLALGFSCWHALAVNLILLPRPLRPGWFVRVTLVLAGVFFLLLGVVKVLDELGAFRAAT